MEDETKNKGFEMTILNPDYLLYSTEKAIREFKSIIRGIKKGELYQQQERKEFKKIQKQQNRRFLRQKIIYRSRRFYEQK